MSGSIGVRMPDDPYRTPADGALPPWKPTARELLPAWQKDPTDAEIALFERLVESYINGHLRSNKSISDAVMVDFGEEVHQSRARFAMETADFAVALRRQLIGRK